MATICHPREAIDGFSPQVSDAISVLSMRAGMAGWSSAALLELCESPALTSVPVLARAFGETEPTEAVEVEDAAPAKTLIQLPQGQA